MLLATLRRVLRSPYHRWASPRIVVVNQGPRFASAEMAALLKLSTQAETAGMAAARGTAPVPAPDSNFPKVNYAGGGLPESQVLEAYRYSGVPRDELPAAAARR